MSLQAGETAMTGGHQVAEVLQGWLENTSEGLILFDRDMRLLYLNRVARTLLLPLYEGDPMGQCVYDITPNFKGSAIEEGYRRALKENRRHTFVAHSQVLPGRKFSVIADPTEHGLISVFRDVTAEGEVEKALENSEARYRTISELTSEYVMSYIRNEAGEFVLNWTNHRFEGLMGLSDDEIRDRPHWIARIHPDDMPEVQRIMACMTAGKDTMGDVRVQDGAGMWRWLRAYGRPIVDPETGETKEILVAGLDVTERKREETLQQFRIHAIETLSSSLDHKTTLTNVANLAVPHWADWCAVDVLDDDGVIQRVAVAHQDPEKVRLGWELWEQYPMDMDATTGAPQVLRTGKPELYSVIDEALLVAAGATDEQRQLIEDLELRSIIIAPIASRGQVLGLISFVSSIPGNYKERELEFAVDLGRHAGIAVENARLHTSLQQEVEDRRHAEEEIKKLNQALEERVRERTLQLQAMVAELEGFTYTIAHDMRAPLRSIVGHSQIILTDQAEKLDEEGKESLHRIANSARRLALFVDELLRFARLGQVEINKTEVNLSELAQDAIAQLAPERREKVTWKIAPSLPALGDADQLRLLLANLFDNSSKYRREGQPLVVELGSSEEGVYFVRDNGIGFDAKYTEKIFQPFERLHREAEYPGTGIGLANTKRIVERHGGRLWTEAEPGKGATFYFTLG